MNHEFVKINLLTTVTDMQLQTGKVPGGPTDLCHKVVVGALTGAEQDFRHTPRNRVDQINGELSMGIARYPVLLQVPYQEIVPSLLQNGGPNGVGIDALLVGGTVRKLNTPHLTAVVPQEGKSPFLIVDSLAHNAATEVQTASEVTEYLDKRFKPWDVHLAVLLNEQEKENRLGNEADLSTEFLMLPGAWVLLPQREKE